MKSVYQCALLVLSLIWLFTGCRPDKKKTPNHEKQATLVYIQWDEGIAYSHLAEAILEKHLNYKVSLISAELEAAYQIVAEENADAFMESWQPVLHKSYLEKYADHLSDLGPVFDSTKSGLVVPAYMSIDSVRHLHNSDIYRQVNGTITGIEQGAGIMETTKEVLNRYGLSYELRGSSGPAMTAALKRAVQNKEPIVVTGWKPHWMFGKWDLKFLEQDTDKTVWTEGAIHIMGRKNLKKDKPLLAEFLYNMKLTENQLYSLMLAIEEQTPDEEIPEVASQWMENHPELIKDWLPDREL